MILSHEVVGDGPIGEVLIVGEAPGATELIQGKPFVGASGQILRRYAASVGLEKVRYENVVERGLPSNDFSTLYRDPRTKTLPGEELQAWRKDLLERIALIKPRIIIAAGAEPLKALTDKTSISDVHCYVLEPWEVPCKVIPVYHPAFILRQPSNAFWLKYGLAKAKEVLEGAADPDFDLCTGNTDAEIRAFISAAKTATEVCIDIETLKDKVTLTALGASLDSRCAISVTPSAGLWNEFVQCVLGLLSNPAVLKIGQNLIFDTMILWKLFGVEPEGVIWDTMHAANILYSDLRKSLNELGRFYLYRAPWKGGWNSTGEKLRVYNAQDIIATHRIYERQKAELAKAGLLEYFRSVPQALWVPSFKLAVKGIKIDLAAKDQLVADVNKVLEPIRSSVRVFADSLVSPGQKKAKKRDNINDVLIEGGIENVPEKERKGYYTAKKRDQKYGKEVGRTYRKAFRDEITLVRRSFNPRSPSQTESVLKNAGVKLVKVKTNKREWEESTNEKALKKILERGTDKPEVLGFVRNMLLIRHGEKLLTSYGQAELDVDGRWRCSYNIEGTETGRSSTKKTPWNTGGNNQNIPRGGFQGIQFKKVFIPDDGKVLFQADQSQAEARVVAALSGCKKMLELFEANEDIHEYAASAMLGVDMKAIKTSYPSNYKRLRQYAKIVNHGGNYDMGAMTLAENAMKDGIELTPKQAEEFLKKRKAIFPEIYAWHESIKEALHKTRTLMTPFGRRRVWLGKIGPEMYREAYAHIPQSTVPHLTNLMWLWADGWGAADVLQMGHDSLLIQLPPDRLKDFSEAFVYKARTLDFTCGGVDNFYIPWDCSSGPNWATMKGL